MFFQKWCLSLLSIVMIKLQVRVLRLMKLHDYLNVPPCIICTTCIIWFRGISGIFGLWVFRKYINLCVSNVHDKEYAPLKQNRCHFSLYFGVKHFFRLYLLCDLWPRPFLLLKISWTVQQMYGLHWQHINWKAICFLIKPLDLYGNCWYYRWPKSANILSARVSLLFTSILM